MHASKVQNSKGHNLKYYLDSGASGHYIPDIKNLHRLHMYTAPKNIQTVSGAYIQARGIGILRF
jgi:hypothetical protein